MAVGGVICCGRWAAGLAGCGVGRCWRWAAGCCEVWQGVQAVQLVGCGVIGAALAVLLVSVCFWLAVRVGRSSPWAARFFPVLIGAAAVLPGADRGGQLAEEKPGRTAQAVHSGFFVSAD